MIVDASVWFQSESTPSCFESPAKIQILSFTGDGCVFRFVDLGGMQLPVTEDFQIRLHPWQSLGIGNPLMRVEEQSDSPGTYAIVTSSLNARIVIAAAAVQPREEFSSRIWFKYPNWLYVDVQRKPSPGIKYTSTDAALAINLVKVASIAISDKLRLSSKPVQRIRDWLVKQYESCEFPDA